MSSGDVGTKPSLWARGKGLLGHRLVKNTSALFIVQMSAYAAPLAVLPYLSRVLSPAHYGLIAFATSFNFYFITLVEYGFNLTATRRIAINADDPEKVSKIFSSVMAAKAFLTLLGFILMLSIVFATPALRPNIVLFCLSYMAVVGDLLFPLWLFEGLQKMGNLVWRDLCAKMLSLSLIFAFVHHDGDYLKAAAFQAGSTVVAGILGLATVPFAMRSFRLVRPSVQEAFTALREGWPVFLSMAAMTLSSSTNTFIMGLKSGTVDVAYYSNAYRLVVALRMMVQPIVTALYPHISHMAVNSRENAVAFLRKYSIILAAPFGLAALVLFFGASPIVRILYSPKYAASASLLRIMAFSPFLMAVQHVYSTFYMLAFGYEKEWSRVILMTTVLNFIILIPLINLIWAPAALSFTQISLDAFVALVTYIFYRRTTATVPVVLAA